MQPTHSGKLAVWRSRAPSNDSFRARREVTDLLAAGYHGADNLFAERHAGPFRKSRRGGGLV